MQRRRTNRHNDSSTCQAHAEYLGAGKGLATEKDGDHQRLDWNRCQANRASGSGRIVQRGTKGPGEEPEEHRAQRCKSCKVSTGNPRPWTADE
jgi:hypothetical protein